MRKITVLSFVLIAVSCSSGNEIPSDIMSINQMKTIVWDLLRAGAFSDIQNRKDSLHFNQKTIGLYQQVFGIYGITKEEFFKSYEYYMQHPDKNKILMDSVMAYSTRERVKLFTPKPVPVK